MSKSTVVPIASAPILLPLVIAGAAVAAAGAICYGLGKGMSQGCKEVFKMCKEGNYPAERLQMIHTPLSNFSGLKGVLQNQGFELATFSPGLKMAGINNPSGFMYDNHGLRQENINISTSHRLESVGVGLRSAKDPINALSRQRPGINPGVELALASGHDLSVASLPNGEKLFLVHGQEGISLISENTDKLQTIIQDFAVQEIVTTLRHNEFKVSVEKKGAEKVINAVDSQKNKVNISLAKGATSVLVDTKKTRKPKCDFIHQLIEQELSKKRKTSSQSGIDLKRKDRTDNHLKIRT